LKISLARFPAFFILAFFINPCLGQNPVQSDSLLRVLSRYEAGRKGKTPDFRDSVKVNLFQKLAMSSIQTDPDAALGYAKKEFDLATKIDYKIGISQAYNMFGVYYDGKNDFDRALGYYKAALKTARRPPLGEAATNTNIGNIYAKQSNRVEALKYMLRGLELAKKSGNSYEVARVYNNIGVLHKFQANFPEATRNFSVALKIVGENGDMALRSMLYHNLGDLSGMQGKTDDAIEYIQKSLELAKNGNSYEAQSMNYNSLGMAYSDKGEFKKALTSFSEALKINERMGNKRGMARGYINIGRNHFMNDEFAAAITDAQKGLPLAIEVAAINLQMNAYELLAKIYQSMPNYKLAYENQDMYYRLKDSVFSAEQDETFSRLKAQYDVKSAQDSLKIVQTKKDILAEAEIKSQNNTRNFIFLVMGIIVIFLIILTWQRNKIAIVKRQKAIEEERNRISRDLHDNLGAQLSTVRMFVSNIKKKAGDEAEIGETVDNSIGLLDASIGELRGIMKDMQNQTLIEKGYLVAAEELINKVNQLHDVKFVLSHHKLDQRPHAEVEHQLYRITQELVNNTLKYAKAKEVSIDVLRRDKKLVMMYEDDGIGYDLTTITPGYGLKNITTRAESIGGSVDFDSRPNAGSRAIIEIPENHG
jgi:signal transduction histidine kinase/Tfp pilus assembly protein PilF